MEPLRAALVSVDYADLLAVTLDWNRSHFSEVLVVTSPQDHATAALALEHGYRLHVTDAFYRRGAKFNKWAALEEGLTAYGRHGWLCLLDADVLWPARLPPLDLQPGCLYTPRRRMFEDLRRPIPEEARWKDYPLHPNAAEWAGYTQIFHASDPALPAPPWHATDWTHAGGADSFFQARWSREKKVRPPFEVLHLGPAGVNWCGRASPSFDGSTPAEGPRRRAELRRMLLERRVRKPGDRYGGERLA